jgi:hypothetical protein
MKGHSPTVNRLIPSAALCALLAGQAWTTEPRDEHTAKAQKVALAILEDALALADQAENPLDRAEAIGLVAATLAHFEPRRALELAESVDDCYEKATGMGEAAIEIVQQNEYLGLSVLGRISDRSVAYDKFAWALLYRARQSVPDAVELAEKIENPTVRNVIQLRVTPALAGWHPEGPKAATEAALEWVESFPFEAPKAEGRAYVAAAQAQYDLPGALELAEALDPNYRDLARRLMAARIAPDQPDQAREIADAIESHTQYCRAVVAMARATRVPDDATAELLRGAAERAEQIDDARHQGAVRCDLALLLAPLDFERALELAEEAWPLERKVAAMEGLVMTLAADDPERAAGIAEDIWYEASFMTDPTQRSIAFQYAVLALAHLSADRAMEAIDQVKEHDIRLACLQALAIRLAPDDPEAAGAIAARIDDEFARAETLRLAAEARAPYGWVHATVLAEQAPLRGTQSKALAGIARAVLAKWGLLPDEPGLAEAP